METLLSNNEIINNLCYDEVGDIYSISAGPGPLWVAESDKASLLSRERGVK